MSRIGKKPIPLPSGVKIQVGEQLEVTGPKGTLSVPKNALSACATPVLWQACADGYSGKFGVGRSGSQVGSATVAGLPSVSANGIAREGRQNQ